VTTAKAISRGTAAQNRMQKIEAMVRVAVRFGSGASQGLAGAGFLCGWQVGHHHNQRLGQELGSRQQTGKGIALPGQDRHNCNDYASNHP
jgi:hypothetical protein